MARLTRAESQARNRDLLITTARRMFLTDGYTPTSLEAVAEEAGFSRGAVYSNFGSKEHLGLAVLERIYAEELAAILEILSTPGTLDARFAALEEWADRKLGEPGWTMLSLDFAAHARHDAQLTAALNEQFQTIRDAAAATFAHQAEQLGLTPALPPQDLATALVGLIIGVGAQRSIAPQIPARVVTSAIRALLTPTQERSDDGH